MSPRVFISSTTKDLAAYRAAAVEVCNRFGLTPVGMEFFGPMETGATAASLARLDESDVYVGIVAFRYGHIERRHRTSVVEAEYRHAGVLGLDRLCFLLSDDHPWPRSAVDRDQAAILRFRHELEREHVRELFTTIDDFRARLTSALVEWRDRPRQADTRTRAPLPARSSRTAVLSEVHARDGARSSAGGDRLPSSRGIIGRLSRPMLFVGLGGVGCAVGTDLDRHLRLELCGLDGTRLLKHMFGTNMLPFQLPSFLQFVYADLDAAQLDSVRRQAVSGRDISIAAARTTGTTSLVPSRRATPEMLVHDLRLRGAKDVVSWLPDHDPEWMPDTLVEGTGGLPALARAALFETLTLDPDRVRHEIREAIRRINHSASDLQTVSDHLTARVDHIDVFVALSVCGGTGAGIFYDYLHLVADELDLNFKTFAIRPLVMLPSAVGGGRIAQLNSAAALVDLCRLADGRMSVPDGVVGDQDEYDAFVQHPPPHGRITMRPRSIEPVVLFGRPGVGATRADVVSSMSAFVQHTIGLVQVDPDDAGVPVTRSFPDRTPDLVGRAGSGIGRRPLATASVASLTLPMHELAEAVTLRFVGEGLAQLSVATEHADAAAARLRTFLRASGLDALLRDRPSSPPAVDVVSNRPVEQVLRERGEELVRALCTLPDQIRGWAVGLARNFCPRHGAELLLREIDVFGLERLMGGSHRGTPDLAELLDSCGGPVRSERDPDPTRPPLPDNVPRRLLTRVRWDDPAVQRVLHEQDEWYRLCSLQVVAAVWTESRSLWQRTWRAFCAELTDITGALRDHAGTAPRRAEEIVAALCHPTAGSASLAPFDDTAGFDAFYGRTLREVCDRYGALLPPEPTTGDLLHAVVRAEWPQVYRRALASDEVEAAIDAVHMYVHEVVAARLRPHDMDEPRRLPPMGDLLMAAASMRRVPRGSEFDLAHVRQAVSSMVPADLVPDGDAPLQMVVAYPGQDRDEEVERFVTETVLRPGEPPGPTTFRCRKTDSLVVALGRVNMGITDVPEVRRLLKLWSQATRDDSPQDAVAWRRRLGHADGYVVLTPLDRVLVLQRLLSCVPRNSGALEP